jgi:hypothetical protein
MLLPGLAGMSTVVPERSMVNTRIRAVATRSDCKRGNLSVTSFWPLAQLARGQGPPVLIVDEKGRITW